MQKNQLISLWEFPGMLLVTFPLLILIIFYLFFVWLIFVLACLSLCLSCMELSTCPVLGWLFLFPCKGSFWLLISSSTFSFCFSTYAGAPIIQASICLKLSQRSPKLSSISFLSFFFFFLSLFWVISITLVFQVPHLLFCLSYSAIDSF